MGVAASQSRNVDTIELPQLDCVAGCSGPGIGLVRSARGLDRTGRSLARRRDDRSGLCTRRVAAGPLDRRPVRDRRFKSDERLCTARAVLCHMRSDLGAAVTGAAVTRVVASRSTSDRLAVRGLQTATAIWSAVGIVQLVGNTRANAALVVISGLLPALATVGLVTMRGTGPHPTARPLSQVPRQVDPSDETPDGSLAAGAGRVNPQHARLLNFDRYPARTPGETQCPRCGHVFDSARSPDAERSMIEALVCPVCSNTWTQVGPHGGVPDVVIRSWLHT